jgi:hypothetical protein
MHHLVADRPLLFIAHDGTDVLHWGEVETGQNISTGQPELETFEIDQRATWEARLLELGITPEQLSPEPEEPEPPPPPEPDEPTDDLNI